MAIPIVKDQLIKDSFWLAGFTSAEGCFLVLVAKSNTTVIGRRVQLVFTLTQHSRDEQLMRSLIKYLNCGNVIKNRNREARDFRVTKFDDITSKIIPFFKKFMIHGVKTKDFNDFCQVAQIMKENKHLTKEGFEHIRKLKTGMNTGRK